MKEVDTASTKSTRATCSEKAYPDLPLFPHAFDRRKGEMTSQHGYASRFPEYSALIEQEFRQAKDAQLRWRSLYEAG